MDRRDFDELVDIAISKSGRSAMRPVIEKEILHYDIFYALDKEGLLKDIVFQGGTSLRLCRGSSRFSEDIDFAGGRDFSSTNIKQIKSCIEDYIGKRYGLKVKVKEPKELDLSASRNSIKVDKWQVSVETAPQRSDLPRQRIKIEVVNIPAYTSELLPIRLNYDFLQGYGSLLINTESINEVMADKIIAFPASTKYIRYRDIWDLAWLTQQHGKLDASMVIKKITDYSIENYSNLLKNAIIGLPETVKSKSFIDQMSRFIDSDTIDKTLKDPRFLVYLINTVNKLFSDMAVHLEGKPGGGDDLEFRM